MNYKLVDRQKKLLDILSGNTILTGDILAQLLSVSSRTIRGDVATINSVIGKDVILSNQRGYSINPVNYQLLRHVDTYFDEKAIRLQLLWLLFSGQAPCHTDELAERFYTNQAVIHQMLKEIALEMSYVQLELKKNSRNYYVEGHELAKRSYLNRIILNEAHNPIFDVSQYAAYFDELDLDEIRQMVMDSLLNNDIIPTEISIDNLVLNIALTLYRLLHGYRLNQLSGESGIYSDLKNDIKPAEYNISHQIASYFKNSYDVEVSEQDLLYIYLLVLGQSKRKYEDLLSETFVNEVTSILSNTMNHFSLDITYERILHDLAFHIYYLIIRSNVGNYTSNALLENIKTYCPFVYDVAVYLTSQISQTFSVTIEDCEIGFLALLIGGLLDHAQNEADKINAVIVCGNHVNIGLRIMQDLEHKYEKQLNLLGVVPRFPHNIMESPNVLYLSCIPAHVPADNVISISSLLSAGDLKKIDGYIESYRETRKRQHLKTLTGSFFHKELFFRNISVKNKYEIIRFLGEKIVEQGYASEDFINSAIKRERISATCFFDSFAIPHAIQLNANKSVFCVLTGDKSMSWDDKKIKFVCMIAVSRDDREIFQLIYPHIIDILCDYQQLTTLSQAKDFETFINYIQQVL